MTFREFLEQGTGSQIMGGPQAAGRLGEGPWKSAKSMVQSPNPNAKTKDLKKPIPPSPFNVSFKFQTNTARPASPLSPGTKGQWPVPPSPLSPRGFGTPNQSKM